MLLKCIIGLADSVLQLAGLSAVSAMAVDWLAKNLYILDVALKRIVVCSLRRNACMLFASDTSYGSLRSATVDPSARYELSLPALG